MADVIKKLADATNDTATWTYDFPALWQKRHRERLYYGTTSSTEPLPLLIDDEPLGR
jgi:hypothetical protein